MLTRNEDDGEEHQSVDNKKKNVERVWENKNLLDISVIESGIPIMDMT